MEGKQNTYLEIILKLGFANVDGIYKALRSGEFLKIFKEYDILGVVETWINKGTDMNITGYNFIGKASRKKSEK